ncbi:hypothetical protein PVL29_011651 [Vitis rotundifolia]|uniref:SHSP domain-containing protein n=1 Tax=Vitis rotundifolia TaxID=103349 RepID=A0AA38ZP32_VITRO|nr:hypothetical protein PVL29_011651 [Vitis rotundifolia]
MALARLALRSLQQRVPSSSSSSLLSPSLSERALSGQRWGPETVKRFSATPDAASDKPSGEKTEVAVSEGDRKSKLFPRKQRKRSLWRNNRNDFVPSLHELFPPSIGNALMQATQHMNRLLENLAPSRLIGRLKEQDQCYKLRFEMPGLAKEDVKISVEDGILFIRGEHREEEEEGSDDEHWSATSYGYHDTSLLLPTDAKIEEIKAELKDGVLTIIIPRSEKKGKDVKEVQIQ